MFASRAPLRARAEHQLRKSGMHTFTHIGVERHPRGGKVRLYQVEKGIVYAGRRKGTDTVSLGWWERQARSNPTRAASRRAKKRRGKEKFVTLQVGHPSWTSGWTEEIEVKAVSVADAKEKARAQGYTVHHASDQGMMMREIRREERRAAALGREEDLSSAMESLHLQLSTPSERRFHAALREEHPSLAERVDVMKQARAKKNGSRRNTRGSRTWAYWTMAGNAGGDVGDALANPKVEGMDVYDPRLEMIRAQRQAIYETNLTRNLGVPGDFRNGGGMRLDAAIFQGDPEYIQNAIRRYMFQMGTGVQQRTKYLKAGTQQPTDAAIVKAAERYEDYDKLLRNRQDYEESLGIARKSDFYRLLVEPTEMGFRYTVWPLPPGQQRPQVFSTKSEAEGVARRLNQTADPRVTGRWWTPKMDPYTRRDLGHWLPSARVFDPNYDPAYFFEGAARASRGRRR